MNFLTKLERRIGWIAIPNLTLFLIGGQAIFYLFSRMGENAPVDLSALELVPNLVLSGQIWRPLTFIFTYSPGGLLFAIIYFYVLYLMGSTLENVWGSFRYTLFILIGILATTAAAMLWPLLGAGNAFVPTTFLILTITLAFAQLNPNYEFLLFFVLPVKVRWIGIFIWVMFGFSLLVSPPPVKLVILAATVNFLMFFGRDIVHSLKARKRRQEYHAQAETTAAEPFHRCASCGATDITHPERQFFYEAGVGYCEICVNKPPDAKSDRDEQG